MKIFGLGNETKTREFKYLTHLQPTEAPTPKKASAKKSAKKTVKKPSKKKARK
jgi:hypothetical protein